MSTGARARIAASAGLVGRELARNRVALGLLVLLPAVFYVVIHLTTGERPIEFRLSVTGDRELTAVERDLSILFIGLASIAGVSAFLAFLLVFKPVGTDRRLVFEGYRPPELLAAKLAVLGAVAVVVALYGTALLPIFFLPARPSGVFVGYLLTALVYGAVGMAVGALVRRDLEGILFLLLLVNLDPGWLQSPVFYAHAHNQELIRALPAHHPGQVAMGAAFTDAPISSEVVTSLLYLTGALAVAGLGYGLRVRVRR